MITTRQWFNESSVSVKGEIHHDLDAPIPARLDLFHLRGEQVPEDTSKEAAIPDVVDTDFCLGGGKMEFLVDFNISANIFSPFYADIFFEEINTVGNCVAQMQNRVHPREGVTTQLHFRKCARSEQPTNTLSF